MPRSVRRMARVPEPTVEIALPCDFLSPRVARRFVTTALHGRHSPNLVEAAELLVSEVVTRVVIAGCSGLILSLDDGEAIMVTVTYCANQPADADRVPGPIAPRLARRTTRIDLDDRTIRHVFVMDEGSARAAG